MLLAGCLVVVVVVTVFNKSEYFMIGGKENLRIFCSIFIMTRPIMYGTGVNVNLKKKSFLALNVFYPE